MPVYYVRKLYNLNIVTKQKYNVTNVKQKTQQRNIGALVGRRGQEEIKKTRCVKRAKNVFIVQVFPKSCPPKLLSAQYSATKSDQTDSRDGVDSSGGVGVATIYVGLLEV